MDLLVLEPCFILHFLELFDLLFLLNRRFARDGLRIDLDDQFVQFPEARIFVGLGLATLVSLD